MKSGRNPFRQPWLLLVTTVVCWLRWGGGECAAGTVAGWGDNSATQIQTPASLANLAVAIAAGGSHSLALKEDGGVVAWGFSLLNQTKVPTNLNNVTSIAAGYAHSLALRADGTVAVWGDHPEAPAGLTNVASIAAGRTHSLALLKDHTVVSWGSSSFVPEDVLDVAAIAAGAEYSLALRLDGTVVVWGESVPDALQVPAGLSGVVAIAAGWDHALALKRDGTVVAWGANGGGQCDVPSGLSGVVNISAGALHSLALKSDGTLASWGSSTLGQTPAPGLANVARIAAGGFHNLAIRTDGAPTIQVQPFPVTAVITRSAVLTVMVSGSSPLRYQWQREGTNIAGATSSTLTFPSVDFPDAGNYRVTITNIAGRVTSATVALTPVGTSPIIVTAPRDQSVVCGEPVVMTAAANGSTPLAFQWLFQGAPIDGATRTRFTIPNVSSTNSGAYQFVATNVYGAVTSQAAALTITVEPPTLLSSLSVTGKQGKAFSYTIRGLHSPTRFAALGLPAGLSLNPTNGVISGIPQESGVFGPWISAGTWCEWDYETLVMSFESSRPRLTNATFVAGEEGQSLNFDIQSTEPATSYDASELPWGLHVDRGTGRIAGAPVYAGEYDANLMASNAWGAAFAPLHLSISNAAITGLSIDGVSYTYSSPYLLDFEFSLRDQEDPALGRAVVVDPRLLSAVCQENSNNVSGLETAVIMARGSAKLFKSFLVLDYTESIASMANGDTNFNGVSDALEAMVDSAQEFVGQQRVGSQVGIYEFHREDEDPKQVLGLTTSKPALISAIGGIATNYVHDFSGGSRAWDALGAAIKALGTTNRDEEHFIVLVSDGRDESSLTTIDAVITAATNNNVKIYCIGFGAELDETPLQDISRESKGRYYNAVELQGIRQAFDQIERDFAGQYILRWATLKRSSTPFVPSFEIGFQGHFALSPTNPVFSTTNITPPATNPPDPVTNIIIATYTPTEHAGSVTTGNLRLVADANGRADSVILRAAYVPRHIRQILIQYRPNWPGSPDLLSTEPGEILSGWQLTETNGAGGSRWLLLSADPTNSIPFAAFGNLVRFNLRDMTNAATAFSSFAIDNSIYPTNTKESFVLDSTNLASFVKAYPALPHNTPGPWLSNFGFTGDLTAAELSDPDKDGIPTWQEYLANTNPRDANSSFRVWELSVLPDGRRRLGFSSAPSRYYRVETSEDLVAWETLEDGISGDGSPIYFVDTRYLPGEVQVYYRVVVH